jgi:flagellar basal-body rod protein FlgC
MSPILANAVSGLQVQAKRFAASAHNVAGAQATVPLVEADEAAGPLRVDPVGLAGGGVRGQTRFLAPGYLPTHDPGDPMANGDGQVARPNVSLAGETVTQIAAQRAYEANLAVLRTGDRMLGSLLDHTS